MKRAFLSLLAALGCMSIAGCGGSGGTSALGLGTKSCTPTSATLNFPALGGYTAGATLNAAQGCFATTDINTYTSLGPVLGSVYVPTGTAATVRFYLGWKFSTTEYATGQPSLGITVPASLIVPGRTFYLAYNGSGTGASFTWNGPVATGTVNGTTITFPGTGANTTYSAGQTFEYAVFSAGA